MTFFFFLPNFLLSGFAFPFRGMPHWAQWIGETLPLTHFIRIVRGIMLKGNGFADMQMDVAALFIFMIVAVRALPSPRYRRAACHQHRVTGRSREGASSSEWRR